MVIHFSSWMFPGYVSFFPLPSHYCISRLLSLPNAMASCCDAPSGCVWDSVVGWHLAASDKTASELCYSFWDDFKFLFIVQGDHWARFFFFEGPWRTKEALYNRLRPQKDLFAGRYICLSVIICSFVIMCSHAAPNSKAPLTDFFYGHWAAAEQVNNLWHTPPNELGS